MTLRDSVTQKHRKAGSSPNRAECRDARLALTGHDCSGPVEKVAAIQLQQCECPAIVLQSSAKSAEAHTPPLRLMILLFLCVTLAQNGLTKKPIIYLLILYYFQLCATILF